LRHATPGALGFRLRLRRCATAGCVLPKDTRPRARAGAHDIHAQPGHEGPLVSKRPTLDRHARQVCSRSVAPRSTATAAAPTPKPATRALLTLVGAPEGQKISDSLRARPMRLGFGVANAESDSVLASAPRTTICSSCARPERTKYAGAERTSMLVRGSATNGKLTESFSLVVSRPHALRECVNNVDGMDVRGLTLGQDSTSTSTSCCTPRRCSARASIRPWTRSLRHHRQWRRLVRQPRRRSDARRAGQSPLLSLELGGASTRATPAPRPGLRSKTNVYQGRHHGRALRDTGRCSLRSEDMRGN